MSQLCLRLRWASCRTCCVGKAKTITANVSIYFPLKCLSHFTSVEETDKSFSCWPKIVMRTRWEIELIKMQLLFTSRPAHRPWASVGQSPCGLTSPRRPLSSRRGGAVTDMEPAAAAGPWPARAASQQRSELPPQHCLVLYAHACGPH